MSENKVWISVGYSRKEKNWKNVHTQWEQFVQRLKKPVVTEESIASYLAMDKDQQMEIKDVGGFVGGVITGGRRKSNAISSRSLITLDVDFPSYNLFEDLQLMYDYEMVVCSTHKHTPQAPRYRLIMPLDREVMADEYEAIARKVAGDIDIEIFDPTTFQPERLMYWPSKSKDAEYVYKYQKGKWVDADGILAKYSDWRDTSQWPVSKKVKERIKNGIDKQEDPTEKGGIIGVFCRAFGIEAAIETFLKEIYLKTEMEDRWTYAHGSTHAGMVVYDDKFSFSYHSSDPTQGRLCNSFDLVRIHLYGDLDADVKEDTPTGKYPSYAKMTELMLREGKVRQMIISEKVEGRKETFEIGKKAEEIEEDKAWMEKLEMDKKRNILNSINNCVIILTYDEMLRGCFAYDDLRKTVCLKKNLPWRKVDRMSREWTDADDSALRNYVEILYGITSRDKINDALSVVIHQNKFHPVRDYLRSITWDKKERLDKLLVDFLGAEDGPYTREVTRKTFVAAVARVFEPGIKFDHVLTLVGAQGIGKSRLVNKMAGEWYSDTFGNLQNKDAMEQIQGVWIMEIGELDGFKRHEVETVKLFVSKQEDRFRVAYGRRVEIYARQCIFIGTTNNDEFLRDQTGNRRFWPVKVGVNSFRHLSSEEVDQVWAEACYHYTMGETLYLDQEIERMAKEVQEDYTEQDDRKQGIMEYLNRWLPSNWYSLNIYEKIAYLHSEPDDITAKPEMEREWVTVPEIWLEHYRGKTADMTPYNIKFIRNIMNKLPGWEPKFLNKKDLGHQRGWVRKVPSVANVANVAKN